MPVALAHREVTHLSVTRRGDFIIVDIKANAFYITWYAILSVA